MKDEATGTIVIPSRWFRGGRLFRGGDLATLRALHDAADPQTVRALAETIHLDQLTVRSALALLTADGWAVKVPNPHPIRSGPQGSAYALIPAYRQAVADLLILEVRIGEERISADATTPWPGLSAIIGQATAPVAAVVKGQRMPTEDRARLVAWLRERYVHDRRSIRQLMAETGRCYGCVRAMLLEAGVTLRSRGGPRGRRKT